MTEKRNLESSQTFAEQRAEDAGEGAEDNRRVRKEAVLLPSCLAWSTAWHFPEILFKISVTVATKDSGDKVCILSPESCRNASTTCGILY